MKPRMYATPAAFKAALEQRLRDSSKSGVELARRRQLLVFDRLLARVTRVLGKAAMLKGGLVLEFRLERARTTRDVDLRLVCSPEEAASLRKIVGHQISLVTPGIRPAGAATGDQKRIMTPARAIAAGADYLVVGRPVMEASDPKAAADAIVAEIEQALA